MTRASEGDGTAASRRGVRAPEVTIVMPVRNEAASIEATLSDVLGQSVDAELEVIVVDGSSTDGTREILDRIAARDPRVRVVANSARRTGTALNVALPLANGRFLIRVDGHSRLPADYVARLLVHLRSGVCEGAGGVKRPVAQTSFGKAVAAAWASPFAIGGSPNRGVGSVRYVDHIPFGAYLTERVRALGGWDEEFIRNQDAEFDYRYVKADGRLLLDPTIVVDWQVRETVSALARQYYQYGYWRFRTFVRHRQNLHARWLAPPALVLALGVNAALAATGRGGRLPVVIAAPYAAVLALGAASIARSQGLHVAPHGALALATIHLSWGCGFLSGAASTVAQRITRRE